MQKILIIEDNKEVRENIAEILELSEYEVICAADGKSGTEKALAEIPDLIICDIMMPGLDGYGVLHLLNKHRETADIPFIFLTAKSERDDFRKGMEMGADDYITKPFQGIELLNAVESRLKKIETIRHNFKNVPEGIKHFFDQSGQPGLASLATGDREICTYPPKHLLYREGERPKFIFYVIKGKIRTYLTNEAGKEFITHIHGQGDFFGYLSMLQDINYKDNAQVLEKSELMLIPRKDFLHLLWENHVATKEFIKLIARNKTLNEENLLNLAYNSLRKKVSFGLLKVMEKYNSSEKGHIELDISREHMASIAGVATESLIRTLSDFKSEGLIEIKNGKILIINEEGLRRLPY